MNFFDVNEILKLLDTKKRATISGIAGSAISLLIVALAQYAKRLLLLTDEFRIRRRSDEVKSLLPNDIIDFVDEDHPVINPSFRVLITSRKFLDYRIKKWSMKKFKVNDSVSPDQLTEELTAANYTREEIVEDEGEFARRGGIIDIFGESEPWPFRFEFIGDELISIRTFDPQSQRSIESRDEAAVKFVAPGDAKLTAILPGDIICMIDNGSTETIDPYANLVVVESGGDINLQLAPARFYFGNMTELKSDVLKSDYQYTIFMSSPALLEKLNTVLPSKIAITNGYLSEGFVDKNSRRILLTEYEVFGQQRARPRRSKFKGLFIDDLLGLKLGDFVVHEEYGIGQFAGLRILKYNGNLQECLVLDYAGGDRVYIPIERLNLVERYVGSEDHPPKLSKLGKEFWFKTKAKVKEATERLAVELLRLYAQRAVASGHRFAKDSEVMNVLAISFPYEETPDQEKALADVKMDMESHRPMDRLICGDVGFGKTEIAVRASLKAVVDKKQVALIAPTTLLAFQHYRTFLQRLQNIPINVEMLSRLRPRAEQKAIVRNLIEGKIDIVIGTHRLLQGDIALKDLGLLIIDEEQRFGVMQKEKLKAVRTNIDTLSLSATPIPRTLYMSLSGIRDVSVIHSPPLGRKSIITRVLKWDDDDIRRLVIFEKKRDGQVFFIHNRIATIFRVYERLKEMMPTLKICTLHGQMKEAVIEQTMIGFIEGKYDILLSTAIVESGLDMPKVNTIIVDRADTFGLADLHQLRGRVGRSEIQAYAYFIIPDEKKITPEAKKRLGAVLTYTSLGSGFRLAIRDMEIRGVGNLLGKEQHGFVNLVGYNLYLRLLSEAVDRLKGRPSKGEPVLDLKVDAYIPEEYVGNPFERIAIYKRLLQAEDLSEIDNLIVELRDRFGQLPQQMENLFLIGRIRIMAKTKAIESIFRSGNKFILSLSRQKMEVEGGIETLYDKLLKGSLFSP